MPKLALPLVAFLAFTTYTATVVVEHGISAVVPVASAGGWSTQIFIDLVVAMVGFLVLAAPDARRRAITLWPYGIAIAAAGSVGMLAYFVRRALGSPPAGHDA
ncbi:MAG: hypothetical protein K0V04_14500 [Deltaproteobacteria bacterium]|nr:hypothetical protein [Deltaproteobacteria bacterium]